MTSDLERGCEDAGPGGGTRGASNKAFGLFFCWTGTFVVAGIFTGVNGGNTAPPFSDAVIFAIVRVAAVAAAHLWVGAVMAVLFERRRVCLWEPNRWRTERLEDFSVWQGHTTSPAISFPAPTSKVLLAFLFVST